MKLMLDHQKYSYFTECILLLTSDLIDGMQFKFTTNSNMEASALTRNYLRREYFYDKL